MSNLSLPNQSQKTQIIRRNTVHPLMTNYEINNNNMNTTSIKSNSSKLSEFSRKSEKNLLKGKKDVLEKYGIDSKNIKNIQSKNKSNEQNSGISPKNNKKFNTEKKFERSGNKKQDSKIKKRK